MMARREPRTKSIDNKSILSFLSFLSRRALNEPREASCVPVPNGSVEMETITLEITIRVKPTPSIVSVKSAPPSGGTGSEPISVSEPLVSSEIERLARSEESAALARKASIGDPNTENHPSARYHHHYRSPDKRRAWIGEWAQRRVLAERGVIPPMPDYSAPTHDAYREKIALIKRLVDEGDVETLKAITIVERSSTPSSLAKYRDLAIHALTFEGRGKRSLD